MTKGYPQPGLLSPRPDSRRKRGPFHPYLPASFPERGQGTGSFSLECLWLGSWEEDAFSGPAPNQGCRGYGVFSREVLVEGEIDLQEAFSC